MDKSNLELFKQALNEAVSNKFDKMADECTEEIVYSERHKLAMRTIVYGKADTKRVWSPKMRRIIAILIAVALLLTSCGIIFRNEIREFVEEFFVKITYSSDEDGKVIDLDLDKIDQAITLLFETKSLDALMGNGVNYVLEAFLSEQLVNITNDTDIVSKINCFSLKRICL